MNPQLIDKIQIFYKRLPFELNSNILKYLNGVHCLSPGCNFIGNSENIMQHVINNHFPTNNSNVMVETIKAGFSFKTVFTTCLRTIFNLTLIWYSMKLGYLYIPISFLTYLHILYTNYPFNRLSQEEMNVHNFCVQDNTYIVSDIYKKLIKNVSKTTRIVGCVLWPIYYKNIVFKNFFSLDSVLVGGCFSGVTGIAGGIIFLAIVGVLQYIIDMSKRIVEVCCPDSYNMAYICCNSKNDATIPSSNINNAVDNV